MVNSNYNNYYFYFKYFFRKELLGFSIYKKDTYIIIKLMGDKQNKLNLLKSLVLNDFVFYYKLDEIRLNIDNQNNSFFSE